LKWSLSGQALSAGAQGILTMMVSTFVSTLLSKTMENIFSKGMYSLADLFPEGEDATSAEGTAWGGRRAAELAFADLLVPQIKEGGAYDILTDFTVCPDKFKGVNNCVMDGKFEAGVRQAQTGESLTVAEAIDQEYLHGEWALVPPSDLAANQDPNSYTSKYTYSNLVKLRKARIISIGWEIAAQSQTGTSYVQLKEVVDRFHDCNYTDPAYPEGKADTEHKYCHLIDPDWILKAPAEQCRARVYGPLLQTTENSFRQETCVDSPTCIAEDDQGNCEGGWGYCTREKNIWRLDGDKCDAQYDTCKLLKRSDGENVAYVTNTVDYGPPCNADDVGCRWYSTRQSKVGDEWQWQDSLTGLGTAARRSDRIFFNKNITQCDEPGCNEFLRTTSETKLNLVSNSSFENVSGAPSTFDNWTLSSGTAEISSDTYFGQKALKIKGSITQTISLGAPRGGRTFALSLYAKDCGEEAATDRFTFGGLPVLGGNFENTSSLQRINGPTHTFPDGDLNNTIQISINNQGDNCLIDAVQLEEGTFASQYHEGWGRTGEVLHLKTAPDYYACYDYASSGALNKTNDAEQCGNYAKACEEKDVGCEQYRPTNGDPSVPGVANYPDDYCPAECVGYQTFKQVATDFEQDKFPVYFIPTTGRTCNAADVGCDQFTSLENEAVANFSAIRRCEKPGATGAAFYTWEGSDTTGYQLKTWNLKMSNVLSAPISDSDPGDGVSPNGGVPPCTALAADGLTCDGLSSVGLCAKADTLTNPDCREFYDAAGLKHYRLYSKTIVVTDDCRPYRKTISSAADCGTSGGRWDPVKSECAYNVYLPESRSCSNEAVGCRAYRGNAGANTAMILNDNFDDSAIAGWDEADAPTISSESLVVGGKSLTFPAGGTIDKNLASSVRQSGLYTLSFWAKGNSRLDIKFLGTTPSGKEFSSVTKSPTNLSFDWRYFSLGPVYVDWSVAAGGETLRISAVGGTTPVYLDNIILREVQSYIYVVKNSWNTPSSCDRSFAIDTSITSLDSCVASGGSWSPDRNECILSALLPQAQLGCASYYDRANGLHYLKSFSRLCSPDVAGCAKLLKTNNNTSATEETFNAGNDSDPSLSDEERLSDNVTIPADFFSYLVVDDAYNCAAQNKGCAEFGSPTLDAAGNVKVGDDGKPQYDTVNLLANPALYNSATGRILCQVGFLSCEEYTTTDGGKLYFKDPGTRLCEWKDNVNLSGQNVSGWFKKQEKASDPLAPCDPANFTGGYYNLWKNGDANCNLPYVCQTATGCACTVGTAGATGKAGTTCTVAYNKRSCPYSGWVGECIPQADQCTKFIDPADTSDDPYGVAYYYIKNDKISSGNCNGMASQKSGCVLFNDTSDPQLDYNANATYWASEAKVSDPGGLVAPVDCRQGGDNCKRCLEVLRRSGEPRKYYWGESCQIDSECTQLYPSESSPLGCQALNYSYNTPSEIYTEKDGRPVSAASVINNSNLLVQVRRDRVCGEWLTCSGTNHTFDPQTGREKVLCEQIDVCNQYAKVGQATTQCTNILTPEEVETSRKLLSKELYVSRDVTFKGLDYSGDSIYNQYQAQDLRSVNVGTVESPIPALAFIDSRCFDAAGLTTACSTRPDGFCASDANDSPCGGNGKCFNHVCVTNFRGDPFVPGTVKVFDVTNRENISCRAYPEQSSPFPNSVVKNWTPLSKKPGFSGANICENGQDCDCSYKKVSYGSGAVTKYFDKDTTSLPLVCVGGKEAGKTCLDDTGCTGGGTCNFAEREDVVLGWNGYCLERDTGTSINGNSDQFACLTWYPMDQIPGMPDLFNNYEEAGYPLVNTNYCALPAVYRQLTTENQCVDVEDEEDCGGSDEIVDDIFDDSALENINCKGGDYVLLVSACWGCGEGNVRALCVPKYSLKEIAGEDHLSSCNFSADRDLVKVQVREIGEGCGGSPVAIEYNVNIPGVQSGDVCPNNSNAENLLSSSLEIYYIRGGIAGDPDLGYGGAPAERAVENYQNCFAVGVSNLVRSSWENDEYFFGCKESAQAATINAVDSNKAWTDRIWREFYRIDRGVAGTNTNIKYGLRSAIEPFGQTAFDPSEVQTPLTLPYCEHETDENGRTLPRLPPEVDFETGVLSCPADYSLSTSSLAANEARPYMNIGTSPLAGSNPSFDVTVEDLNDPTNGLRRVNQIFAKVYEVRNWILTENRYNLDEAISLESYDITEKEGIAPGPEGTQWPAPPQVWPITKCTGENCVPLKAVGSMPVNGVTVGGISGFGFTSAGTTEPINVVSYGGQYVAVMQFFGTADPNAGPIRDVQVDWNDGSELGGTKNARYKNHLGIKDDGSSQCDNTDFSRSTGACVEDYFYFTHTYKCPNDGLGVDACTSDNDTNCFAAVCPENVDGAVAGNGSCCVFKPRVQLKDNWGWCNGSCVGRAHGCYEFDCRGAVSGQDPWTYFAGKVIVVPK
jgi:hypothetical protein